MTTFGPSLSKSGQILRVSIPTFAPVEVRPSFATRARAATRRLMETTWDSAATVARVALGALMFPHGAQHGLGWFGGYGFSGTLGWMTKTLGFPAPLAALAIITEV